MFTAADKVYLATRDYQNGRWRFRAGQFVVVTEPMFMNVLAGDGMLDALVEIDQTAFTGKAKVKAKDEAKDEPEPLPVDEAQPVANATVAGGKVVELRGFHLDEKRAVALQLLRQVGTLVIEGVRGIDAADMHRHADLLRRDIGRRQQAEIGNRGKVQLAED